MKKHLKNFGIGIVIVLGLALLPLSCTKDDGELSSQVADDSKYQTDTPNKDDTAKVDFLVRELGFLKENIQVTKDYIIAEGDIGFYRSDFWNLYKLGKDTISDAKRHYKTKYKVTSITTINVLYDRAVNNTSWVAAINTACAAWNSLGGKIILKPAFNSGYSTVTGINIKFGTITGFLGLRDYDAIAKATFPSSNGYPGNSITIDINKMVYPASFQNFCMVHEIGHCIGLMHTDDGNAWLDGGSQITGISDATRGDGNSVMSSVVNNWINFTQADKEAFLYLYK